MNRTQTDALIVGAGFAGLYQLYTLRDLGLDVRVIEKGSGVGGTWYWNRYPGCRCDVESMAYSYSFDPELEQEWEWTERYPSQPEILKYINHVADRYDLRPHITFDTTVTRATFDEEAGRWTVETDTGEEISAQFVIMATGCLSKPKAPEIPGAEDFHGSIYHTAEWPHDRVDFSGQDVAVIGTGSSGIQSIPLIAKQADSVTVFQRTPNFSMPAQNRPLEQEEIDEMKAIYREYREAQRNSAFGIPMEPAMVSALQVSEEERTSTYQEGWNAGSLVSLIGSYSDILSNREANETAAGFVREKIHEIVEDPEIAETLSPRSYALGTKRPCLDTGYYKTFNEDHVHLVDVRETPLERITEEGIRTTEANYDVDSIVFATGFDAMTGALLSIDIRGIDDVPLRDVWSEGPRSYLGLAVAGFPNMFTITGPTSPSVLSNMMVSIEQHVEWITDCIRWMREHNFSTIDAIEEAQEEWLAHNEVIGNMTLYPETDSWYTGANVPGKPRVFMCYIGGVNVYRVVCDTLAASDYQGFAFDMHSAPQAVPAE